MSRAYEPRAPFNTVLELYNPTYSTVKGVTVKEFYRVDRFNASFKTYGGTESTENGVYTVLDTATVETWYRPDITAASRVVLGSKTYEVIGEPEDINQRHQYLKFKVRSVKGGS